MKRNLKLKDFELKDGNHFIAMEYYNLILNRTFLVLILEDCLLGLKIYDLIGEESNSDFISKILSKQIAISGDLEDPYSYIDPYLFKRIQNLNIYDEKILKKSKASFKILFNKIVDVKYDKSKKWGMGYYPHDGKVYVIRVDEKPREFIILGSQSGEQITNWIKQKKLH